MQALLAVAKASPLRAAAALLVACPLAILCSPLFLALLILAAPILVPSLLFVGVG